MKATNHFYTANSRRLHFLRWGDPHKPAVIMLHGLRGYAQTWQGLADSLGDDFCCYALDQRGRGDSDWGPVEEYHTPFYVADLEALVEHLQLAEFILVGHSLGGTNALEYIRTNVGKAKARVRALVIEDIGPGSSNAGEGAERIRREMRNTPSSFADWQAAEDFWCSNRKNLSTDAVQSRLQHSMREVDGKVVWKHDQQGIAQARLTIEPIDLWPAVMSVACKALLIKGGDSDFLPLNVVNEICQRNDNFSGLVIDHASHYVHDDQAQQFNQAVKAFLTPYA